MARQYLIPNWGFVSESGAQQRLVPGQGFINETQGVTSTGVGTSAATASVSGVGASITQATATIASTGTVTGLAANNIGAGTITCAATASGTGSTRATITGYLLPNWGYLHETNIRQYLIPNWGYVNETQTTGVSGRIICSSTVAGVGIVGPSIASIAAVSTVAGTGTASGAGAGTSTSVVTVSGAGSSRFYSPISYTNFDDLFNYISLAQSDLIASAGSVIVGSTLAGVGAALSSADSTITSTSEVTGVASPPTFGQLDFSVTTNSGLIAGVM